MASREGLYAAIADKRWRLVNAFYQPGRCVEAMRHMVERERGRGDRSPLPSIQREKTDIGENWFAFAHLDQAQIQERPQVIRANRR